MNVPPSPRTARTVRLRGSLVVSVALVSAAGHACRSFGESTPGTLDDGGPPSAPATGDAGAAVPTPSVLLAERQLDPYDVIAVQGTVYWSAGDTIWAKAEQGPVVVAVTGLHAAQGLATANGYLYWANWFDNERGVMRISLDGGLAETIIADAPNSNSVAVDGEHLAWTVGAFDPSKNPHRVQGASADGGAPRTLYAQAFSGVDFSEPAVGGDEVYWLERGDVSRLMRAKAGGLAKPLVTNQPRAGHLTIDDRDCYWTTINPTGAIVRAPRGGGEPETVVQGLGNLGRITNRGGKLFVHDLTGGALLMVDKATHEVQSLAKDQERAGGIYADDAFVYWTARGPGKDTGTVRKVAY